MEKMISKKAVAQLVVERFPNEAKCRQVLTQALEIRRKLLATRRRRQATYAELGKNIYTRIKSGEVEALNTEFDPTSMKLRIDGLLAEQIGLEEEFRVIMEPSPLDTARDK